MENPAKGHTCLNNTPLLFGSLLFSLSFTTYLKPHLFNESFLLQPLQKRCITSQAFSFSSPLFLLMLLHSFKSIILLFHILCLHAVQTIDNTPELSCLRHLLHTNVMTIISIRFFCFSCCILHKMCFIWHLVQEFLTTESFRPLSSVISPSLASPPPNHVPKCNIYIFLKYPQGWRLSCFPGQPLPVPGNPLGVKSWEIAKMVSIVF